MMNRYCMYVRVLLYCLCTFVVPSVPVGGVVVSVYQSGPQPDDLTAVVNWKKLSPMELRGEFVKYIVEINRTVSFHCIYCSHGTHFHHIYMCIPV